MKDRFVWVHCPSTDREREKRERAREEKRALCHRKSLCASHYRVRQEVSMGFHCPAFFRLDIAYTTSFPDCLSTFALLQTKSSQKNKNRHRGFVQLRRYIPPVLINPLSFLMFTLSLVILPLIPLLFLMVHTFVCGDFY